MTPGEQCRSSNLLAERHGADVESDGCGDLVRVSLSFFTFGGTLKVNICSDCVRHAASIAAQPEGLLSGARLTAPSEFQPRPKP